MIMVSFSLHFSQRSFHQIHHRHWHIADGGSTPLGVESGKLWVIVDHRYRRRNVKVRGGGAKCLDVAANEFLSQGLFNLANSEVYRKHAIQLLTLVISHHCLFKSGISVRGAISHRGLV